MVAIITQARINSSRLPNKIFLEAGGQPFLHYHIQRLRTSGLPIVVATTNDGSEKPIVEFCRKNELPCFCGDEQNVLKRFYDCAEFFKLGTIIRVTSDCPLIDGNLIARGLQVYQQYDDLTYYSNAIERSYPRGMDYEIFSFRLLQDAFENADDSSDKEHVTPYIWKNKSGHVRIKHDLCKEDNTNFRITLDTAEDQLMLTRLIEEHDAFSLDCDAIVELLKRNPQLAEINKFIEQKKP